MGLPVTRVQVGVADGVATMKHPAIAHIDAHMGNPRRVISPREEYQVAGFGAACPVSYTHLDVYKRQKQPRILLIAP